jgi:hypothetical protein
MCDVGGKHNASEGFQPMEGQRKHKEGSHNAYFIKDNTVTKDGLVFEIRKSSMFGNPSEAAFVEVTKPA